MRRYVIISLFLLSAVSGCQTQYRVRKLANEVDTMDKALKLKEKCAECDIVIHKLDSAGFFNNRIYSRLTPGALMQIGKEQSSEADLYKLLSSPGYHQNNTTDTLNYYVLQIHLK